MSDVENIPNHVGYILDGNRRWAKRYGLPTYEGHLAGYNALKDVVEATAEAGVKYISFYTFSTENWKRAASEVRGIMNLIRGLFKNDLKELRRKGYKLVVLGSHDKLPKDIIKMIEDAESSSVEGHKATLVMCFNYGGQQEIVSSAERYVAARLAWLEQSGTDVAASALEGGDAILNLLQNSSGGAGPSFENYLQHSEVPPCDLIVRTSGEQRLSNFMLWRAAYSEFIFLEKYWPEMTKSDVDAILEEYFNRKRRFGE